MDKKQKNIDYRLLFSVFLLVTFWMVMISSVSVFSSYVYTWGESNSSFLEGNIKHILISTLALFFIVKLNYKNFTKFVPLIYLAWIFSLILVLVVWKELNWAKWWLDFSFLPFAIQPAEFMKVWIILWLSYAFSKYTKDVSDFKKWFMPFMWIVWLVLGLLALQPDFGSILVIAPVSAMIFFVAWWNVKHLLLVALSWILLLVWVYNAWKYDAAAWESRPAFGYIYDRFNSFLWSEEDASKASDVLYQQDQAVIAIGSGWLTWVWFWESVQKFWYIPEVHWDFIFSVIVEELWFIWMLVLLSLYFYIAFRCLQIYRYSKDDFARYYSIWIACRILMQSFVNISVNTKLLPNTWITLPFISYWGSSLLSLMIALWILLSMSKYTENSPVSEKWKSRWAIDKKIFMFK